MARTSIGRPRRLLSQVFVIAAATTAMLSLDATVVLLTPVVLATARAIRLPAAAEKSSPVIRVPSRAGETVSVPM